MLLILTSKSDLSADFLIARLIELGLPYFRLNTEDLAEAQYNFAGRDSRRLVVGERALDLIAVRAVWYRRAIYPTASVELPPAERFFVAGELRHLIFGLVWEPAVRWVNPIDKVFVAEHKLYQLRLAEELGMTLPRTLVSSSAADLRAFVQAQPNGAICKPIFHGLYLDGVDSYSVYTRTVTADEFTADTDLQCPVLLQERISRGRDLRITFIGQRCFGAEVQVPRNVVDWRAPESEASFAKIDIEEGLHLQCTAMLQKLGLEYGAFDFIETPEGERVFLEVNPTGEWAWLENRLGFPMRQAFVELFYES